MNKIPFEEDDKAAFVIAYGIMGISGLLLGLLFGWLIWGR